MDLQKILISPGPKGLAPELMALENPLPPRQFRDINADQNATRRSIKGSSDRLTSLENGADDEGSVRMSSKIDMKQLVSAGKMSISPSGRDIVMASRDGLFIIDLDNPLNLPAFLPQGGMWEIADVQWNPHSSWSNYILSTSGEKLLVWNLGQGSKTHIEHILQSHIRAITDINWHNSTPSRLATCAIDSWVWLWDLRAGTNPTGKIKPTMGLSAFNESATQVKWNFRNPHILASSHNNQVLVWDERKGSKPINEINAHDSKIYGVNWSRFSDYEITTCSLDKTIKKWDASKETESNVPLSIIRTEYPVWRARSLPFGRGILAQPQRGRNALDMYRNDQLDVPVHSFDGFTELVTEFVWRSRGIDKDDSNNREFELVTWDRDSILRLWPVDVSIMEKVGYSPTIPRNPIRSGLVSERSYRDELELQSKLDPVITAPTHQSGVLKSIKASQSHGLHRSTKDGFGPSSTSPVNYFSKQHAQAHAQSHAARVAAAASAAAAQDAKYGNTTMGKGHGAAARPKVDPIAWWSAVGENRRRSTSTGGSDSARRSTSLSRGESRTKRGRRSGSRVPDQESESEGPHTLKEEIAQAGQKYKGPKIALVDIILNAGSRKCSIEMHGPTGLFIRILFTFHDDYPGGQSPIIDIDSNHINKISPRKRAFILRELRDISAKESLVIEPCIRFLLGLPGQGLIPKPFSLDSDSDDENVQVDEFPGMDTVSAPKIQQNQPPRERTSQAVFSANGTLVRIVRSETSRAKQGTSPVRRDPRSSTKTVSHLGNLPLALRALAKMATALPAVAYADPNSPESSYEFADSFSTQPGVKHTGILGPMWNRGMPFMHRAKGKASVFIEHYPNPDLDDFDPELAGKFTYTSKNPMDFCSDNALVAALHGRTDYRRILESLAMLLRNRNLYGTLWGEDSGEKSGRLNCAVVKGIHKIYENLLRRRNLQMLAMFSMAILLADSVHQAGPPEGHDAPTRGDTREDEEPRIGSYMDYFSLRPRTEPPRPVSPVSPIPASPEAETPPAASTPPPQKSLAAKAGASFGGVLYPFFFTGTSEGSEISRKSRGSDPPTPTPNEVPGSIPVPRRSSFFRQNARSPRQHRGKSDASVPTSSGSVPAGSTSAGTSSFGRLGLSGKGKKAGSTFVPTPGVAQKTTITFALLGQPKGYMTSSIPQERYRREGKIPLPSAKFYRAAERHTSKNRSTMPEVVRARYITHVHVYAELLFRAGLLEARIEVLSVTNQEPLDFQICEVDRDHLTIRNICRDCGEEHEDPSDNPINCPKCLPARPGCAYCRLPVRGLSRTCLKCKHTIHLKCWDQHISHLNRIDKTKPHTCASGCGCECPKNASFNVSGALVHPVQKPPSPVAYLYPYPVYLVVKGGTVPKKIRFEAGEIEWLLSVFGEKCRKSTEMAGNASLPPLRYEGVKVERRI